MSNTEAGMAATKWSVAHLTTGGKLSGNPHLWYLVIWHLVRKSERWQGEAAVLANMDEHMKYRAKTGQVKIALSGLPDRVQVRSTVCCRCRNLQ
jgi:hypothetical protein